MRTWLTLCMIVVAALFPGCDGDESSHAQASSETVVSCSETWYGTVEAKVSTGDGRGHGPDVGSDEWKSVVEFKLGIRGKPDIPSRGSDAWCRHIDQVLESAGGAAAAAPPQKASGDGPSFDCGKVEAGGIEAVICGDEELAALDRKLAEVYAAASKKATNEHPPILRAEQRGWIKGRDECWKSDDQRGCIDAEYRHRIAELQARYRLVPANGPTFFACDGNPANEVVVTYFETDPPTLIAERGDSSSLMVRQPSGSGTRYQGRNESFREHQGEATITWGYDAPEMNCKQAA
jgi:uncharacterized protein